MRRRNYPTMKRCGTKPQRRVVGGVILKPTWITSKVSEGQCIDILQTKAEASTCAAIAPTSSGSKTVAITSIPNFLGFRALSFQLCRRYWRPCPWHKLFGPTRLVLVPYWYAYPHSSKHSLKTTYSILL